MNGINHTLEGMALLALSHTPVEQRLYEVLRSECVPTTGAPHSGEFALNQRRLLTLTGLNSFSTLRRARRGLIAKLSIECRKREGSDYDETGAPALTAARQQERHYRVYQPAEVFERRLAAGLDPFPKEYLSHVAHACFTPAIERVAHGYNLSRREAQVALCCAEGLTNSEIGAKLFITEQTVKFHLRHVFAKFGVRRRAELISRLLRGREGSAASDAALYAVASAHNVP
jgi:DNA-binding CsgD family transcriptional regulator